MENQIGKQTGHKEDFAAARTTNKYLTKVVQTRGQPFTAALNDGCSTQLLLLCLCCFGNLNLLLPLGTSPNLWELHLLLPTDTAENASGWSYSFTLAAREPRKLSGLLGPMALLFFPFIYFLQKFYLFIHSFIYLAVSGLSCSPGDLHWVMWSHSLL